MPRHLAARLTRFAMAAAVLAAVVTVAAPGVARADTCRAAIADAAARTGVPFDLLRAVAAVESGLRVKGQTVSWPWAVHDGRALLFRSRTAALAHVEGAIAAGRTSVDIGCMQINWRWHGHVFRSPAELIEPRVNALYAALYLLELRREFGTWDGAVRAYHSRDGGRAAAYRCRVAAALVPGRAIGGCTDGP